MTKSHFSNRILKDKAMKSKKKSRMSKVHTQLLSFKFDNKNNAINDSKKSMSYDFGKIPKGLYPFESYVIYR